MTERTLANLRHVLETNYVRSTVESASEAERALYTPESIAKCELIAMQDNALSIARWAQAIAITARHQKDQFNAITAAHRAIRDVTDTVNHFEAELEKILSGRAYPTLSVEERERQAKTTDEALQRAKKDLLAHTQALRDLQQSYLPTAPAPHQGQGETSPGCVHLDGGVYPVP